MLKNQVEFSDILLLLFTGSTVYAKDGELGLKQIR